MGICLSDKNLVYNLASLFQMVSSPGFSVSMFVWSLPVAVPLHSSHVVLLLLPASILSLVHHLCQCGFWYFFNVAVLVWFGNCLSYSWSWLLDHVSDDFADGVDVV